MRYHDTVTSNHHNILCPACESVVCHRCIVLEERMAIENFDGCDDCQKTLRRYQRAYRKHRAQDHGEAA